MNYYKGQKLVCVGTFKDADGNEPNIGEVVTCAGQYAFNPRFIGILEYPRDAKGLPQSFNKKKFVPLEEWEEVTEAVEQLKEELYQHA